MLNTAQSFVGNPEINHADAGEEADSARVDALKRFSLEAIQRLDVAQMLDLQGILNHGNAHGVWVTPKHWCPGRPNALATLDIRGRILSLQTESHKALIATFESQRNKGILALDKFANQLDEIISSAVSAVTRYLLILRMTPAALGRKGARPLKPSSICDVAYTYVCPMAAAVVERLMSELISENYANLDNLATPGGAFFRLITNAQIDKFTGTARTKRINEVTRLMLLNERGLWSDIPNEFTQPAGTTPVMGAAPTPIPPKDVSPYLPLPDQFCSELGLISHWLIEDIAPNLISILSHIEKIWESSLAEGKSENNILQIRRSKVESLLSHYVWSDKKGDVFHKPKFPIYFTGAKPAEESPYWPPKMYSDVMGLVNNVQAANIFVVGLSTGGRKLELTELKRWCVKYDRNGNFTMAGKTFKLVEFYDGQLRNWVLPDFAACALELQLRLVMAAERIGPLRPKLEEISQESPSDKKVYPDHMFASLAPFSPDDRYKPLTHLNNCVSNLIRAVGLDSSPGGQKFSSHRFRKTLARLCALALTQAPKILMDVFGHKSIEMTLYYILTDRDLQVEIETVARELRIMRAAEVVSKMVDEELAESADRPLAGFGGPAALALHRAVKANHHQVVRSGELWGAKSAYELAEILTLQGKAWQSVRMGVICTKFPGTEVGPCNQSRGNPEPSKCQPSCNHRLEEGFLREDIDGAIAESVQAFDQATMDGDDLARALWADQIATHIKRFADLERKWASNPIVIAALMLDDDEVSTICVDSQK